MGDVHWDTASASFDSEYAKLHSGGPKEVQNGVAGKPPKYVCPPSASLRHVIEILRVPHFGDFKKLSNEILMSFDTAFFQKLYPIKISLLTFPIYFWVSGNVCPLALRGRTPSNPFCG